MRARVKTHIRRNKQGRSVVRRHSRRIVRSNRLFGFGRKELPVKYPLHPFSLNLEEVPGQKNTFLLTINKKSEDIEPPRLPSRLVTYGGRKKKKYIDW